MKEVIKPVRKLMEASGQNFPDAATAQLYLKLIAEESEELADAVNTNDEVAQLDAVCDLVWVLAGFALAKGWLLRSAWEEVVRSNLSKIPEDGVMLRREDGKFLKGPNYTPPDLKRFLQ